MRIVFIRSNPVFPDPRVEKEVTSLHEHHHDVQVLAWDRSKKYKQSIDRLTTLPSVKITRFGIPANYGGGFKTNLFPLIKFQLNILKWLFKERKNYDVIHACDFDTAFTGVICAKLLRKKVVYDMFDSVTAPFNGPKMIEIIVEKIDIIIMNHSDALIICTEKRKEQIYKASPKKLEIIHNTPSQPEEILNLNLNKNKIKIAYIGILTNFRFIEELANVVINNPKYELHIGGFGDLESKLIKLANENENIFFYGKVTYDKTLEIEKSCDIMTAIYDPDVPNHYYAAPNKFYEALMLGKPLIMVKNTGMSEIVAKHGIGELMDYTIEGLEEAIKRLVERKSEWPEISNKMYYLYENLFSWKEMEGRLVSLYDNLNVKEEINLKKGLA